MYEEEIHFGKLLLRQIVFDTFDRGDLDLWSSDPKLGFFCFPGWTCGLSLRKVGQGVLMLLIGNKKVIDVPTNRHVHSQICHLFIIRGEFYCHTLK